MANTAAPGAPPTLGLVPLAQRPAGVTYLAYRDYFPAPPSAPAFNAMQPTYSNTAFTGAGWRLIAARIFGIADVNRLLARASLLNPVAVVIHYVGHGDADPGGGNEVWSCRGYGTQTITWTDTTGTAIAGAIRYPTDGVVQENVLVSDVKRAMQQIFPTIPLTLVTDACDQQGVINLGGGSFRVIVCDSGVTRDCAEGAFTTAWASVAAPNCFSPDDTPTNGRTTAIPAANTAMAAVAAAGIAPQVSKANPP